jgi:hypothetical protein
MAECSLNIGINKVILVNKRAKRFFIKNIQDGNIEKIEKQIKKGTVKILHRS